MNQTIRDLDNKINSKYIYIYINGYTISYWVVDTKNSNDVLIFQIFYSKKKSKGMEQINIASNSQALAKIGK